MGILVFFIVTILATPFILSLKSYGIFKTNMIAIPLTAVVITAAAWWMDTYPDIKLASIGYEIDGMSENERARHVPLHLREEAKKIFESNMGVGWPLKAFFWLIGILPYPSLVWVGVKIARWIGFKKFNRRF